MSNTYIDCITYTKAPTGLTLAPFIGNMGRISSCAQGATSLTVPATTVALSQYDAIYVFDGPNSEVLQVGAAGAIVGATSIPLQSATQYAHAAGVPYCTDGTDGSLGEQIFTASKWLEDEICFQALWSTAYTNEILTMPTMRASIDNQGYIHFRPRHFPISSIASIAIQQRQQQAVSYDPMQAIMDSDQQTVDIPLDVVLPASGQGNNNASIVYQPRLRRTSNAWITLAYTAGFAVGSLPRPIQRACTMLTSDLFKTLENPIGADSIQQNKRKVEFAMRGDTSGESLLYKEAVRLCGPYTVQSF